MPNKICYAKRSTNGKKRARSHRPVFLGKVFEVRTPKTTILVIVQQCYPMNSHICKPERVLSLMKMFSIRACSRGLEFYPTLRCVRQKRRGACSALVGTAQDVGNMQTWVQEEA